MRLVAQASLLIIAYFTLAGCIKTPGHEGVSVEIIDPKTGSLTFAGESTTKEEAEASNENFNNLKPKGKGALVGNAPVPKETFSPDSPYLLTARYKSEQRIDFEPENFFKKKWESKAALEKGLAVSLLEAIAEADDLGVEYDVNYLALVPGDTLQDSLTTASFSTTALLANAYAAVNDSGLSFGDSIRDNSEELLSDIEAQAACLEGEGASPEESYQKHLQKQALGEEKDVAQATLETLYTTVEFGGASLTVPSLLGEISEAYMTEKCNWRDKGREPAEFSARLGFNFGPGVGICSDGFTFETPEESSELDVKVSRDGTASVEGEEPVTVPPGARVLSDTFSQGTVSRAGIGYLRRQFEIGLDSDLAARLIRINEIYWLASEERAEVAASLLVSREMQFSNLDTSGPIEPLSDCVAVASDVDALVIEELGRNINF